MKIVDSIKNIQTLIRVCSKMSIYLKLIFILIVLLLSVYLFQKASNQYSRITNIEGFQQKKKFVIHQTPVEIYDNFYVSIYDDLVYDINKNNFEIGEIVRITKMQPKQSKVLDIGCGKGHHCHSLHNRGVETYGMDISPSMIEKAKKKYPNIDFRVGDALTSLSYPPHSFTHILSLYFSVYYIQDKKTFFKNCFDWLIPGGYLALHLVNRDKFSPIINASDPFIMVSPQKYAKERITKSNVKFYDFQYKANFQLEKQKDMGYFDETFKNDATGQVRQNKHTFYMPTQKDILAYAKDVGFILRGKIDMVSTQYEYQYIYILQKPE